MATKPIKMAGQTAADMAEQAGLGQGSQGEVLAKMEQGQNPDAAVGSVLTERANAAKALAPEQTPTVESADFTQTSAEGEKTAEKTGTQIGEATAKLSEQPQSAYDRAFDMLDNMAVTAKSDREQAIANIEKQKEASLADAKTAQRMESGAVSMKLARMGGYLGNSGSGMAYMQSLSQSHRLEATKLEAAYAAAVEQAKAAYDQKDIALAENLMNTAQSYQTRLNQQRTLAMQEATQMMELKRFEREDDASTLTAWASQGYEESDIPSGLFDAMDANSGYQPGTARALFSVARGERATKEMQDDAARVKAEVELQSSMVTVLSKMRPTEKVTINGKEYHGTKTDIEFKGYEIDKATGDIAMVSVNTQTGQAIVSVQKGVLQPNVEYVIETGSDRKLWYVPKDPTKGGAVPVMATQTGAGINTKALYYNYPTGVKPVGTTYGWCLEFARLISDDLDKYPAGSLDTIEAKRGIVEADLNVNNITAGNWILTNEDSKWGHIALITDVSIDPTIGSKVATVTESNGPGYGGRVNNSRTIVLDEANMEKNGGKIMGFKRADLVEQLTSQGSTLQLEAYEKPAAAAEISGMNPKQQGYYLAITRDYNKAPMVAAVDTLSYLSEIADQVIADPGNGVEQTKAMYGFIKGMDYNSVVREGELALAGRSQSVLDTITVGLTRIEKGQVISPKLAEEMALAVKDLERAAVSAKNKYDEGIIAQGAELDIDENLRNFINTKGGSTASTPTGSFTFTSSSGKAYKLPN
jgi:hypothetical protein